MNIKPADAKSGRSAKWARAVAMLALVLGVLALLGMLSAGPLYCFGLIGLRPAFSWMGLGAQAGVVAIVIGLIGLVLALLLRRRRPAAHALLGIVLGLLAFVPPWMFRQNASQVPPIHDISTDTIDPPKFETLLPLRADAPNSPDYAGATIAAQQQQAYPDIQTLRFDVAPAAVFEAALKTAMAMGWAIEAQAPAQGRIEATATTFWFGFKDDVVIRIQAGAQGTRLDIRSVSRVGKSDVGKNAARIRDFRTRLEQSLPHS